MEITHRNAEEQAPDEAQDRIAEVAMEGRHGARGDAAEEAVAHDQLVALLQGRMEGIDGIEGVAVVGIGHDDEASAGGVDACPQGGTVAAHRYIDHPCSSRLRNGLRAVRGAVVGNQDFTRHAEPGQAGLRLGDADAQGRRFVEAGHQNA